MLTARSKLSV